MIVNIVFTLIMLALAFWDMKSFNTKAHKDFKSLMMSLGILGTFVGIFIGLLGFDTRNLLESVPTLLDGLKTAFYTSIVGMGLAIVLSIYQKGRTKASEDSVSELDFITTQVRRLDELNNLRELPNLVHIMQNINAEIAKKQDFESQLKGLLKDIDTSLHKALESLASGASKELIKALEIVISDFNNNLKEQFGENFKQLNEATKNMLTWQENYKDSIESNTDSMRQMQHTLQESQSTLDKATEVINANKLNLEEMRKYHELNATLQENLMNALNALNSLESSFEEKLHAISSLKDSSILALQSAKDFIDSIKIAKDNLESYFRAYDEKSLEFFTTNTTRLHSINTQLQNSHIQALDFIKESHSEFSQSLKEANTQVLESFKAASSEGKNLATQTTQDLNDKSNALMGLTQSFKTSADSMVENLHSISMQSIDSAKNVHENTNTLLSEKFRILNDNLNATNATLQENLQKYTDGFSDLTQNCVKNIESMLLDSKTRLSESVKAEYESVASSIAALHSAFKESLQDSFSVIKEKILESSNISKECIESNIKQFIDSSKACVDENINLANTLTNEHIARLQDLHKQNMAQIESNLANTKDFLTTTHNENMQTLEDLHKHSLQNLESASTKTMENTINNLQELQKSYKENLQQSVESLNENLLKEVTNLQQSANETFNIFNTTLQAQHSKTTDSIFEAMKNSSQYFIQTSGDFNDLLKGQYKRMNTTFDRHTQDLSNFLESQSKTLKENLESQTQQLSQDLVNKGDTLHEFLQTQSTCLDTNLQQMLSKFNKMLEHNYINLSDMLEKDNELIIKSLDSQAINISNNLLTSHKKIDDFFYTAHSKFSNQVDSMLERLNQSNTHISNALGALSSTAKSGLDDLSASIKETYEENKRALNEGLRESFNANNALIGDINKNLNAFVEGFNTASISFEKSAENIAKNMQSLQEKNALLSESLMSKSSEFSVKFSESIESAFNVMNAKNADLLNNLEAKVRNFDSVIKNFELDSKSSFESLSNNFKNLCVQYIKLMQASMQTNIKNQNAAAADFNKAIAAIQENVATMTQNSGTLFKAQKDSLDIITQSFKQNTDILIAQGKALQENIGSNLENLDSKMEKMTQGFANNYAWFLKKVKEIIGQ